MYNKLIIKLNYSKHKRTIWIAFAIVFLVILFLLRIIPSIKNSTSSTINKQEGGLAYNNEIISDLVNKDTDGDGILDWEESLWGTDPTKKETTMGTLDSVAIEKLKIAENPNIKTNVNNQSTENLTETDKFSREFFSTVATLNQSGAMDEATAEKISSSLAERIQNSNPRKVYVLSDIKTAQEDNSETTQIYINAFYNINSKNLVNYTITDVLQKFVIDENNVDSSVLSELNPIIEQINTTKNGMLKINVPKSLSVLHLNVINGIERLVENLTDLQLYDTDVIMSLSAMTQYEQNANTLNSDIDNLLKSIQTKLNN